MKVRSLTPKLHFYCEVYQEHLSAADCIAQQSAAEIDISHPRESKGAC